MKPETKRKLVQVLVPSFKRKVIVLFVAGKSTRWLARRYPLAGLAAIEQIIRERMK